MCGLFCVTTKLNQAQPVRPQELNVLGMPCGVGGCAKALSLVRVIRCVMYGTVVDRGAVHCLLSSQGLASH